MGGPKGLDINVLPVWKQGLTGKGVVIAVLDTGEFLQSLEGTTSTDTLPTSYYPGGEKWSGEL